MGAISAAGKVNKKDILRTPDAVRALQCPADFWEMFPVLSSNEEIFQL